MRFMQFEQKLLRIETDASVRLTVEDHEGVTLFEKEIDKPFELGIRLIPGETIGEGTVDFLKMEDGVVHFKYEDFARFSLNGIESELLNLG